VFAGRTNGRGHASDEDGRPAVAGKAAIFVDGHEGRLQVTGHTRQRADARRAADVRTRDHLYAVSRSNPRATMVSSNSSASSEWSKKNPSRVPELAWNPRSFRVTRTKARDPALRDAPAATRGQLIESRRRPGLYAPRALSSSSSADCVMGASVDHSASGDVSVATYPSAVRVMVNAIGSPTEGVRGERVPRSSCASLKPQRQGHRDD
jgi:hypothetical protein